MDTYRVFSFQPARVVNELMDNHTPEEVNQVLDLLYDYIYE